MDIHSLEKRLEIWKRILFIIIGASIILFVQAGLNYLESGNLLIQASWLGSWFIVQLATFFPGFVLLWGKHWMHIPLHQRINTIFGYFAIAWFTMLPVGFRVGRDASKPFNIFLLGGVLTIAICYWWLRRKSMESQSDIFP